MLKYLIILVLIVCLYGEEVQADDDEDDVEGYYWRDYTGAVPKDALIGGRNVNRKPTYIGQILYRRQLIPAKIDPEFNRVSFESGYKEYVATTNIKILCTRHPEQFEWLISGNGIFNQVRNRSLIPGGYEEGASLFIGRIDLNGVIEIGKVISTNIQTTLNTVKDGEGIQHASFTVLAFNPNIKIHKVKKCIASGIGEMDIDVRSGNDPPKNINGQCKGKLIVMNFFNL